jgi:hypothetical protein
MSSYKQLNNKGIVNYLKGGKHMLVTFYNRFDDITFTEVFETKLDAILYASQYGLIIIK